MPVRDGQGVGAITRTIRPKAFAAASTNSYCCGWVELMDMSTAIRFADGRMVWRSSTDLRMESPNILAMPVSPGLAGARLYCPALGPFVGCCGAVSWGPAFLTSPLP